MLRTTLGLFLCLVLIGCGSRQEGYVHGPNQFTDADKFAVHVVEQSPLGDPAVLRKVVDGLVSGTGAQNGDRMEKCEYTVQKVIERHATKNSDGRYPEVFRVGCLTNVGKAPQLQFVWQVEGGYGLEKFEWGWSQFAFN